MPEPITTTSTPVTAEPGGSRHVSQLRAALALMAAYVVAAVPAALWFQPPLTGTMATLLLGSVLVVLSCIDIETYLLPDALTLPLAGLGLLFCVVLGWDEFVWRVAAALTGYGTLYGVAALYRRSRGHDGLGMGDAKLFAAAGAWLGFDGLPSVLLAASLIALAFAGLALARGVAINGQTRIPFGPYLAFGFWLVWLYGPMTLGL